MLRISKQNRLFSAALAVIGLGVPAAFANSVLIDTMAPNPASNGDDWQVTRLGGGYSGDVVNVAQGSLPDSWVKALDVNTTQDAMSGDPGGHNAQWVSDNASAGVNPLDVNGQEYTYTDTFTLGDFIGEAIVNLSGTISSDNWIPTPSSPVIPGLPDPTGVTLTYGGNDYPVTLTLLPGSQDLGQETMYRYAFDITTSGAFISPTDFTLKVNVVNSYEDPNNGTNPGPTGLILAGTASAIAVPLPATADTGLALLFCIGGFAAVRRRASVVA